MPHNPSGQSLPELLTFPFWKHDDHSGQLLHAAKSHFKLARNFRNYLLLHLLPDTQLFLHPYSEVKELLLLHEDPKDTPSSQRKAEQTSGSRPIIFSVLAARLEKCFLNAWQTGHISLGKIDQFREQAL